MPRNKHKGPLTTARAILIAFMFGLAAYAKYVEAHTEHASSTNATLIGH